MSELLMVCEEEELEPCQEVEFQINFPEDDYKPIFLKKVIGPLTRYKPETSLTQSSTAWKTRKDDDLDVDDPDPCTSPVEQLPDTAVPKPVFFAHSSSPQRLLIDSRGCSGNVCQTSRASVAAPPLAVLTDDGTHPEGRVSAPEPVSRVSNRNKFKSDIAILFDNVKNGKSFLKTCPGCGIKFKVADVMWRHMKYCCYHLRKTIFAKDPTPVKPKAAVQPKAPVKRKPQRPSITIRLNLPEALRTTGTVCDSRRTLSMHVSDYYYGTQEGKQVASGEHTDALLFKCKVCSSVLKNNIRFMDHMRNHVVKEIRNPEGQGSQSACTHCFRTFRPPMQLQHHVESVHSQKPSDRNCGICELAFSTEKEFLRHMQRQHNLREMPYVCQVCSFRSSFYSDVQEHFRSTHRNTKEIICCFCLRRFRTIFRYSRHFVRHKNKTIFPCNRCRLSFITRRAKIKHNLQHQTITVPEWLKGLPKGTVMNIYAPEPNDQSDAAGVVLFTDMNGDAPFHPPKRTLPSQPACGPAPSHTEGVTVQSKPPFKQINNEALISLNKPQWEEHLCIECSAKVTNFYCHFPRLVKCGACQYQTSCKNSFGNHMIWLHSTISKSRFHKMKKAPRITWSSGGNFTLTCVSCCYSVTAMEVDAMSRHLATNQHYTCKVLPGSLHGEAVYSQKKSLNRSQLEHDCKNTVCVERKAAPLLCNTPAVGAPPSRAKQEPADPPNHYEPD